MKETRKCLEGSAVAALPPPVHDIVRYDQMVHWLRCEPPNRTRMRHEATHPRGEPKPRCRSHSVDAAAMSAVEVTAVLRCACHGAPSPFVSLQLVRRAAVGYVAEVEPGRQGGDRKSGRGRVRGRDKGRGKGRERGWGRERGKGPLLTCLHASATLIARWASRPSSASLPLFSLVVCSRRRWRHDCHAVLYQHALPYLRDDYCC